MATQTHERAWGKRVAHIAVPNTANKAHHRAEAYGVPVLTYCGQVERFTPLMDDDEVDRWVFCARCVLAGDEHIDELRRTHVLFAEDVATALKHLSRDLDAVNTELDARIPKETR